MPNASYLQTSFLGGQWSTTAQGRADEEAYRTALNKSFNALPIEAGAHTRRPGTVAPAPTRRGLPGVLREFAFSQDAPFNMEFTDNHLRLWAGTSLMLELVHDVIAVSNASPAVLEVPLLGSDWATGDEIEVTAVAIPGTSPVGIAPLLDRQFLVTVVDSTHVSISDPVTGAPVDGSTIDTTGWSLTAAKVVDFTTPYVFGLNWKSTQIRIVQDEEVAFVLAPGYVPQALENVGTDTIPTFTWTTPVFLDGPYLDPPTDGSTLTPSSTSGTITLTASALTSINDGQGFLTTDVDRMIRLLSEPLNWSPSTTYAAGDKVRFETGAGPGYYQAIVSNVNVEPDLDNGTNWAISTTAAAWTWAIVDTVVDPSHVTATLQPSATDLFQQPLAGGNLLYTNPVTVWRLGAWSGTTGYPTCGGFQGTRFWFGGPAKNAFAATMSEEDYNFAPTLLDGTVADNNGIAATIKSKQRNTIFWIEPVAEGLVLGTQGGEWLVQASTQNEPITASSIKADPATQIGCANVEPRNTGLSLVMVQRYTKQVYEYLADVYSRKFSGTNLARRARSLTAPGVVELAYVKENAPVLWVRTAEDNLIGCTYKRSSPFATQTPADFFGWHFHTLGSDRTVESISAGPSADGTIDALAMVTNDIVADVRYVEFMQPVFEETDPITAAWFVDSGVTPAAAEIIGSNIVFYGLLALAGKTLTAWIGGVDAGDYVVSPAGTMTVPLNAAGSLLTTALLQSLDAQGGFGLLGVDILVTAPGKGFFSPTGAALNYVASSSGGSHYARGNFDWDAGLLYHEQAQHAGDPGTNGHSLFVFNIETRAQVAGPLDPGELAFAPSSGGGTGPSCIGYDGNIYYGTIDSTHLVGRYNVTSHTNDLNYNDTHALDAVGYIAPIHVGDTQFAVITSTTSGTIGSRVVVIQMTPTPQYTGAVFTVDEAPGSLAPGNAFPCRGPERSAFVVGVESTQLGIYRVIQEGAGATNGIQTTMVKIGVVTPAQVSGAWSSISFPVGGNVIYDETDGNLIMLVRGSDSTFRLIKVNTHTAVVMWTLTLLASVDFHTSRVRGGRFSYIDGTGSPYTLKEIDTIAGTVSGSSPTETVLGPNLYSTDDTAGQVILNTNDIGTTDWSTFGPAVGGGAIIPALYYTAPAAIGFNYISQGQILRPIGPQETGSQTGPAQGQTRRSHMYAALLSNSQGIQVGTDFAKMRAAKLVSSGRTVTLPLNTLFSDIVQDTLEDTASFNSMWAWQTVRPYPTTVVSVECWIKTEGR